MKLAITKKRNLWWAISGIAVLASIIMMVVSYMSLNAPIRPGLDFVGGTRIQISRDCSVASNCQNPLDTNQVRNVLDTQGLANSTIQLIGEDKQTLSIRTQNLDGSQRSQLLNALSEAIGKFDPKTVQIDSVGATVGEELFTSGILALLLSFFGIIVYLSFRFQFDYALFAIIALVHDVLITAGVFSLLGLTMGVEIDSLFLVSLLTIIGFSVNDTVVIYDRIRENFTDFPDQSINEVVDNAVNQTLGRSINTTLTTLLPLISIFLFGGQTLKFFALALIIGFVSGAYSSIFVASTLLAWWRNKTKSKNTVAVPHASTSK
ncbi:protein-export membrane protein SecF [Chondrocystis sp. NIES-4102]|nr:protein-export membrane protein SecF [Chondrocystis sp. NIES-4102]